MTDTTLPDVIVRGQKVRAPSPFSGVQWPTKGNPTPPQQNTDEPVDDTGEGPATDESQQCAIPEDRREWNKDAAARRAQDEILAAAFARHGETDLFRREYGALLCEMSPGVIEVGEIREGAFVGPPVGGRGGVDIPVTDCGAGVPVGFVHSHTSLNPLPSEGDFGYLAYLAHQNGISPDALSVYTLGTLSTAPASNPHAISHARYPEAAASQQPDYVPEWVDPNATPCPEE